MSLGVKQLLKYAAITTGHTCTSTWRHKERTEDKSQPLYALKVCMLNRSNARISKQLLRVVIDQLPARNKQTFKSVVITMHLYVHSSRLIIKHTSTSTSATQEYTYITSSAINLWIPDTNHLLHSARLTTHLPVDEAVAVVFQNLIYFLFHLFLLRKTWQHYKCKQTHGHIHLHK